MAASIDTTAGARVDDTTIASLREQLAGELFLPGEPGYEVATPWNVAVPRTPRAVVAAASAADVVATVRFAAAAGLRVSVQRTGHGAVPLGGEDDVLLVHTGALDECTVDAAARTARVGAGVVWQQVIDAAAPHGLAALAGSAPGVGVVGFLTGGGIGPFVRTYGMSADYVRAFELVTGRGEMLRVTPTDHAELYWGLRGGKGSLGIVTAVEFELVPLAAYYGGALYFDGADAPAVLEAWRTMCEGLPEHSSTSLAILQLPPLPNVPPPLAGKMTVAVRFASVAQAEEAEPFLAPLRAVAEPLIDMIATTPYAAVGSIHADPTDPMPGHEASGLLRELTPETVEALLAVAGPGSRSPQAVVELRQLGGALAREPEQKSAFCHRGAAFSVLAIGVLAPEIAEIVPAHGAAVIAAMEPWATGGKLPNFAPSADPAEIALAYDEDTRAWLGALAAQNDPDGVLDVGQVVRA
jgi:UDP-N-acetylenolpyruvoylglucosamine reductase